MWGLRPNNSELTSLSMIPASINTIAMIEQTHVKGINAFLMLLGFRVEGKYKNVKGEMQKKIICLRFAL